MGIQSASTETKAQSVNPRAAGRFKAGRNPTQWTKTFLERGYVKLSSLGPWALETLYAGLEQANETAKRVMRSNR